RSPLSPPPLLPSFPTRRSSDLCSRPSGPVRPCRAAQSCRDRLALGLHSLEQLDEGVGELLHALLLERLADVVVIDSGSREVREELVRGLDVLRQGLGGGAVVLE